MLKGARHNKIVGITGARSGMTVPQRLTCKNLLEVFARQGTSVIHHGDCEGADAQANRIADQLWLSIVLHPPFNDKYRAFCTDGVVETRPPKGYIERNHDIVEECDIMLAFPRGFEETRRSGTWATIRYARKVGRRMLIVYPDGIVGKGSGQTHLPQ